VGIDTGRINSMDTLELKVRLRGIPLQFVQAVQREKGVHEDKFVLLEDVEIAFTNASFSDPRSNEERRQKNIIFSRRIKKDRRK